MSFQNSSPTTEAPFNLNKNLFSHISETEMGWIDFEALMYQYWTPDFIKNERHRICQTWFDYRHIHPVLRSFVFAREYVAAYQRAYVKFVDKKADHYKSLPPFNPANLYRMKSGTIKKVLSRMHLVDEMGFPYDTFFDATIKYMLQQKGYANWRGNHSFLKRYTLPPIYMLADAASLVDSMRVFERRNAIKLTLPKHSHYRANRWIGTNNQRQCAEYLIGSLRGRGDRNHSLAKLVYELGYLREHEVLRHLGKDVVLKIRSIK